MHRSIASLSFFLAILVISGGVNACRDSKNKLPQKDAMQMTEVLYEGAHHLVFSTLKATWYYDTRGGGLSRIIDSDGNDWIAFKSDSVVNYPGSAAGFYRGIPNFVHGSVNNGAGHPGFDRCRSTLSGNNRVTTRSIDEKWHWEWTFTENYAVVQMLKTDPEHPYWFLYEGPVGGRWDVENSYWGTEKGIRSEKPDYFRGQELYENWKWAFFGHNRVERIMFVMQADPDDFTDTFGYLGNTGQGIESADGMAVFGFGRGPGASPLMTGRNTFIVGFFEQKINDRESFRNLEAYLEKLIEKYREK